MCVILMKEESSNQALVGRSILAEGCRWSQESDVSVHDFSAFLDRRSCKKPSSSVLLLINLSLKACSASFFPEHRELHS